MSILKLLNQWHKHHTKIWDENVAQHFNKKLISLYFLSHKAMLLLLSYIYRI